MVKKDIKKLKKKNENPFEKFGNSKKKHEVINRRVKGEDRDIGRARGKVNHKFNFLLLFLSLLSIFTFLSFLF